MSDDLFIRINKKWVNLNEKLHNQLEISEIEGKEIRAKFSKVSIKIKRISPSIGLVLGWIMSDGSLPKNSNNVSISQKSKEVLLKLREIINHEFGIKKKYLKLLKKKDETYVLSITVKSFRVFLVKVFGMKTGKNKKRNIPKIIWKLKKEIKIAFLAGFFEGDGNIYLISPKKARLMITCKFKTLAIDLEKLFEEIGIKNIKIVHNRTKNVYVLQTHNTNKIAQLISYIYPYLIHREKIKNIHNVVKCEGIYRKLRVSLFSSQKKQLIESAVIKVKGKNLTEKYKELAKNLSKELNFEVSPGTIRTSWKYTNYSLPLSSFLKLKEMSNEKNYTLPEWMINYINLRNRIKYSGEKNG